MTQRSMREVLAGRGFLLLPAAALAVHELRYRLAYGGGAASALASQGHSYLDSLAPWLVLLLGLALGGFLVRVAGSASGRSGGGPQRSFATVTTNVPGPRETLYCLGRRMVAWYPYVPITQGLRVGTAILSYAGRIGFGVTTDSDSVKDAAVLAQGIEAGVAELLAIARAHAARRGEAQTARA